MHDQFVLKAIQALGVTKAEWIADYFRLSKTDTRAALKRLAQTSRVCAKSAEAGCNELIDPFSSTQNFWLGEETSTPILVVGSGPFGIFTQRWKEVT